MAKNNSDLTYHPVDKSVDNVSGSAGEFTYLRCLLHDLRTEMRDLNQTIQNVEGILEIYEKVN